MADGLGVLHKSKVFIVGIENRSGALKTFMKCAKGQDSMFDGGFRVAQLKNFLAPKLRIKELRPLGESVGLEVEE